MKKIGCSLLFVLLMLKGFTQPLGYQYGKVISINSAVVTGTNNLSDFPFLFKVTDPDLRSVSNGGNVSSVNGYDIIFTDVTCASTLKHDLEKYNPVTGELTCWIKIPSLNYSTNTTIHIYYGNATVTVPTSTTQTWSSDYSCVLHLGNNPAGTAPQMLDATSAANSGTCLGSMTATNSVTGKIGSALLFDEIDDGISITDFDYTQSFTISFWFHLTEVNGTSYQYMYSHGNFGTTNSANIYIGEDNLAFTTDRNMLKNIFQDSNDGTSTSGLDATTAYVNSFWHYYAFVVGNSGGATVYVDGIQKAYLSILGGNSYDPATNIFLGCRSDLNSSRYLGGMLDEFRILSEPRSADWIATEYTNQNSPATYYSVGSQITATALCVILPIELTSFKASTAEHEVELKWETASEKNNAHFAIEKSGNGTTFHEIGRLKGAGTSSSHNKYSFTDVDPFDGLNYYRLKHVDMNGQNDYSEIVAVSIKKNPEEVCLFPNPSEGKIHLKFPEKNRSTSHQLLVFDETGTAVYERYFSGKESGNVLELDLAHLHKGFYFIQIEGLRTSRIKLVLK